MKRLAILVTALFLISCSVEKEIEPTLNREGEIITLTIETFKDEESLNESVINPARGLQGQATYYLTSNECSVKLIKPRTIHVDDEYALTLGHEIMHCIYGDYH